MLQRRPSKGSNQWSHLTQNITPPSSSVFDPILAVKCDARVPSRDIETWFIMAKNGKPLYPPLEPSGVGETTRCLMVLRDLICTLFPKYAVDWKIVDVQRYGQARSTSVAYPLRYSDEPFKVMQLEELEQRLLSLNQYILDDFLDEYNKNGLKVGYLKELQIRKFVDLVWIEHNLEDITIVAQMTLSLVNQHYFTDGNIRTAILLLYELLHTSDYYLDLHPLIPFTIISCSLIHGKSRTTEYLGQVLFKARKHLSRPNDEEKISPAVLAMRNEQLKEVAARVKELPIWATQLWNLRDIMKGKLGDKNDPRLKVKEWMTKGRVDGRELDDHGAGSPVLWKALQIMSKLTVDVN